MNKDHTGVFASWFLFFLSCGSSFPFSPRSLSQVVFFFLSFFLSLCARCTQKQPASYRLPPAPRPAPTRLACASLRLMLAMSVLLPPHTRRPLQTGTPAGRSVRTRHMTQAGRQLLHQRRDAMRGRRRCPPPRPALTTGEQAETVWAGGRTGYARPIRARPARVQCGEKKKERKKEKKEKRKKEKKEKKKRTKRL